MRKQKGTSMTRQKPSIGRIVRYVVAESDPAEILSNDVRSGDELAAVIVRFWPGSGAVNLRVLCDGPSDSWKTSVAEGTAPGQWHS